MENIKQLLHDLYSTLSNENQDNTLSAHEMTQSLSEQALRIADSRDITQISHCNSLLFVSESPPNSLHFIRDSLHPNTCTDDDMQKARQELYELFDLYGKIAGIAIGPSSLRVVQTCLNAFKREQRSAEKAHALNPIERIVRLQMFTRDEIRADELINTLYNDYVVNRTGQKRSSNTLKGRILRVLGLLGDHFPGTMRHRAYTIIGCCIQVMQQEFIDLPETREPYLTLLAGAIQCLDFLLSEFSTHLAFGSFDREKDGPKIYTFICEIGIHIPEGLGRFTVSLSALSLLARHSFLFKDEIVTDRFPKRPMEIFKRLLLCCRHRNRNIRLMGLDAMESVLRQIALKLADMKMEEISTTRSHSQELFYFFMSTFTSLLGFENRHSNQDSNQINVLGDTNGGEYWDISIGVVGIECFAPAIAKYAPEELQKLLVELFQCSERVLLSSKEKKISSSSSSLKDTDKDTDQMREKRSKTIASEDDDGEEYLSRTFEEVPFNLRCSFFSSIASVIKYLPSEKLETDALLWLETKFQALLVEYPSRFRKQKQQIKVALMQMFVGLLDKGSALKTIIRRTLFHWLVRTLSIRTETADSQLMTLHLDSSTAGEVDERLLQYYLPLWTALLEGDTTFSNSDDYVISKFAFDSSEVERVSTIIYDQLLSDTISLLNSLELNLIEQKTTVASTSSEEDEEEEEEESTTMVPVNATDYALFLNLIDFIADRQKGLFRNCQTNRFTQWAPVFARDVITLSRKFPNVSGFYTLIELTFDVCTLEKCFTNSSEPLHILLVEFLREVLLHLPQFRDELLLSALYLILRAPQSFINSIGIESFISPIQQALHLGKSWPPVAGVAIRALERWLEWMDSKLNPFLPNILPVFDEYLSTSSNDTGAFSGLTEEGALLELKANAQKNKKARRKRAKANINSTAKIPKEKEAKHESKSSESAPLKTLSISKTRTNHLNEHLNEDFDDIQILVLRFLGNLGGRSRFVIDKLNSLLEKAVKWSETGRIKLAIPLGSDTKIDVLLDSLLPRVQELATTSTNRRAKIAACELLHAVVIYMVGQDAHTNPSSSIRSRSSRRGSSVSNASSRQDQFSEIFEKLFPSLLHLATDVENVCRQLFRPLTFQLVRWFARSANRGKKITILLLDAVADGAGHPTDAGLRKVCAEYLAEFFKWALKQSSDTQLRSERTSIAALLRRLYSLCRHPQWHKRVGASIAFCHLYREFREYPDIIDIYSLQVMRNLILSLRVAHRDTASCEASSQVLKAIRHFQKIITSPQVISDLIEENEERAEYSFGLTEFIRWLFNLCAEPETQVRRCCMRLFLALVRRIPKEQYVIDDDGKEIENSESKSSEEWNSFIQSNENAAAAEWMNYNDNDSLFENLKVPNFNKEEKKRDEMWWRCTASWLENLIAYMDFQDWKLASKLRPMSFILSDIGHRDDRNSKKRKRSSSTPFSEKDKSEFSLLDSLHLAIGKLILPSDGDETDNERGSLSTDLVAHLSKTKTEFLTKLFNFSSRLISLDFDTFLQLNLLTCKFFSLIFHVTLNAKRLGLGNLEQWEEGGKLLSATRRLCRQLNEKLISQKKTETYNDGLRVLQRFLNDSKRNCNILTYDRKDIDGRISLVRGHLLLHSTGWLNSTWKPWKNEKGLIDISNHLVEELMQRIDIKSDDVREKPRQIELDRKFFTLAVEFGWSVCGSSSHSILSISLGKSSYSITNDKFASIFCTRFHTGIIDAILRESVWRHCVKELIQAACAINANVSSNRELLSQTLKTVTSGRTQVSIASFVSEILSNLYIFSENIKSSSSKEIQKPAYMWIVEFIESLLELRDSRVKVMIVTNDNLCGLVKDLFTEMIPVRIKCNVLRRIMPHYFTKEVKLTIKSQLAMSLQEVVVRYFPIESHSPEIGSEESHDFLSILNAMLYLVEQTRSPKVLQFLQPTLSEKNHRYSERIKAALRSISSSMPCNDTASHDLWMWCFQRFADESKSTTLRMKMVEDLCVPMLQNFNVEEVVSIMTKSESIGNKSNIIQYLENAISISIKSNLRESLIVRKTGSFLIIDMLYRKLSKSAINDAISTAASAGKGPALTKHICRFGRKMATNQIVVDNNDLNELLHQCYCASYNCLISVVSKTQKEEKYFFGLLWKEKKEKNELIWSTITSSLKEYKFEIETDFPIIQLSSKNMGITLNEGRNNQTSNGGGKELQGLSSQYLMNSTVIHGLSQVGFISNDKKEEEDERSEEFSVDGKEKEKTKNVTENGNEENNVEEENTIAFELDPINAHPCMTTVLTLIDKMTKDFSSSGKKDDSVPLPPMPPWMNSLYTRFIDADTKLNACIFICKLVMNRSSIFEPWANEWLLPCLQLVHRMENGHGTSRGFHYFLRDLCTVLVDWSNCMPQSSNPESKIICSRFINHLISVVWYKDPQKTVVRDNIRILRSLIFRWKDYLTIDWTKVAPLLTEKCILPQNLPLKRLAGLQVLSIAVVAGLLHGEKSDRGSLWRVLAKLMNFQSGRGTKQTYEAAAEVCGQALRNISIENSLHGKNLLKKELEKFKNLVVKVLMGMRETGKVDRYLRCMYKLALHYGPILDTESVTYVTQIMKRQSGEFLTTCLKLVQMRFLYEIDSDNKLCRNSAPSILAMPSQNKRETLQLIGMKSLYRSLSSRHSPAQLATLGLLSELVIAFSANELEDILNLTRATSLPSLFFDHPLLQCRMATYKLLLQILTEHPEANISKGSLQNSLNSESSQNSMKSNNPITLMVYRLLLRGFRDSAQEVRELLYGFWDSNLPAFALPRLSSIFETFYDSYGEEEWLQYSGHLMLSLSTKTPDYNRPLFENSLADCVYHEQKVNSLYSQRPSTMTPKFSSYARGNSQSMSQSQRPGKLTQQMILGGGVRATQAPAWEPTQIGDTSSSGSTNSTTGLVGSTTVSTLSYDVFSASQIGFSSNDSSMSVDVKNGNSTQSNLPPVPMFNNSGSSQVSQTSQNRSSPSRSKRFQKTRRRRSTRTTQRSRNSTHFLMLRRVAFQRSKKKAQERVRNLARKGDVHIYRSYRKGEIPDIQIPLKDMIAPLRALCELDAPIASEVLVLLYSSLCQNLLKEENEMKKQKEKKKKSKSVDKWASADVEREMMEEFQQRKTLISSTTVSVLTCLRQSSGDSSVVGCLFKLRLAAIQGNVHVLDDDEYLDLEGSLVQRIASMSGNVHGGIRVLEEHLIRLDQKRFLCDEDEMDMYDDDEDITPKGPSRNDLLDGLLKMFGTLKQDNAILSLVESVSTHTETKCAVAAELRGDYEEAYKLYRDRLRLYDEEEAINIHPIEINKWEDGHLQCLRELQDWNSVYLSVMVDVDDDSNALWNTAETRELIVYYLRSALHLEDYHKALFEFVDNAASTAAFQENVQNVKLNHEEEEDNDKILDRWKWLRREFPAELATIYVLRRDFGRASSIASHFFKLMTKRWGGFHQLAAAAKEIELRKLQAVIEVYDFANAFAGCEDGGVPGKRKIESLIGSWKRRMPSSNYDDVGTWNAVVGTRGIFTRSLINYAETQNDNELRLCASRVKGAAAKGFLKAAEGALACGVLPVARRYMKESFEFGEKMNSFSQLRIHVAINCFESEMRFGSQEEMHAFAKKECSQKQILLRETKRRANELNSSSNVNSSSVAIQTLLLEAKVAQRLSHALQKLTKFEGNESYIKQDVIECVNIAFDAYSKANEKGKELLCNQDVCDAILQHSAFSETRDVIFSDQMLLNGQCSIQWSRFCDRMLRAMNGDDSFSPTFSDGKGRGAEQTIIDTLHPKTINKTPLEITKIVICNSLQALAIGTPSSASMIPRLLQLLEMSHDDVKEDFLRCANVVPAWRFLKWTSQMMASLSGKCGATILKVLERMAFYYPQALYYAFSISRETLPSFVVGKLPKLLDAPLHDIMVKRLHGLRHPHQRWNDHIKKLTNAFKQKKFVLAKQHLANAYKDCLDEIEVDGDYNKAWAKTFRKRVDKIFSKGITESAIRSAKKLGEVSESGSLSKVAKGKDRKMGDGNNGEHRRPPLRWFSHWLDDFDGVRYAAVNGQHIELFCQYGNNRPQPEHHVRLESCGTELLSLASKEAPKRIQMRGSDEKEKSYLVKGGEDLRLDQRIEQIFVSMNEILDSNVLAARQKLKIRVFNVIPMTSNVGLLEWVPSTMAMEQMFDNFFQRNGSKKSSDPSSFGLRRQADFFRKSLHSNVPHVLYMWENYPKLINKVKSCDISRNFQNVVNDVPNDFLRQWLIELTDSPEGFLSVRNNFSKTFASFSIASYILGIGDRHLGNFLLDKTDGGCIGIDFGYSFGQGCTLPVPELIPFRLTPQFQSVLRPLDSTNILRQNMQIVLQALQEKRMDLLDIMEVFIQEPLLDWTAQAQAASRGQRRKKTGRKESKSQDDSQDENAQLQKEGKELSWYPRKKITTAAL
eukprot:g2172.t1